MNTLKFIIADDHPVDRYLHAKQVCELKHDVVAFASDGKELIECANNQSFDYVLSDTVMPILDGFAACKKLKEIFPACKFIITSAYQDLSFPIRLKTHGVDAILIKGFPTPKLNNALQIVSNYKRYIDPLLHTDIIKSLPTLKSELSELSELSSDKITLQHNGKAIQITENQILLISALYHSLNPTAIADLLKVTPAAVNQNIKRMKARFDVTSKMELIRLFVDSGLIRNISQQQNGNEE
jgi:DNA-binding NarL/FixJ family response regulator